MLIALIVYLAGVLTILSPCILPVLPFVFARADRRFATNGLPMLIGMAATFAAIATLAAVGGAWAVRLNQSGRWIALAILALFALTLISKRLADWLARPFVSLGNRMLQTDTPDKSGSVAFSLLLGVATGLLWAPCAGPVLGLVLTGAALSGPSAHTTVLLFAYAAGAATSLGVALLAGGRVFAALKRSIGARERLMRGVGITILLAVAAIALGWDGSVLTRWSTVGTSRLEKTLIDTLGKGSVPTQPQSVALNADTLPVEQPLPELDGATTWFNSPALTADSLKGKVVLVDFWTYSCINCLRALPYIEAWYAKYKDYGLVVLGVHTPEFAFEKDAANVRQAVTNLGIRYPVALDDQYEIWRAFSNQYWPAHYFVDAKGDIRAHHFGEGSYEESEQIIRRLLTEAGHKDLPPAGAAPAVTAGVQAAPDLDRINSEETYVGYERAKNFSSPGGLAQDHLKTYQLPAQLPLNEWALSGSWTDEAERAVLQKATGSIAFRFQARDLHLVMGPSADGKPIRFRVRLNGAAPGANHGADTNADGDGVVDQQRLYQLIRQSGTIEPQQFSIEFLDGGIAAYSFTFG